jgi:hypothetical protein
LRGSPQGSGKSWRAAAVLCGRGQHGREATRDGRGMVRLTRASKRSPIRMRDHAASTALRHFACRRGSEDAQRRSRDEMALKVEIVVDGSVHTGKAPGGSSRFEPLHFCALVVAPPDTSFLHDCSSGAPVRGDMPAADAATPRRRNAVCRSPDGPRRRGGAVPAARTSPSGRQQARDTSANRSPSQDYPDIALEPSKTNRRSAISPL